MLDRHEAKALAFPLMYGTFSTPEETANARRTGLRILGMQDKTDYLMQVSTCLSSIILDQQKWQLDEIAKLVDLLQNPPIEMRVEYEIGVTKLMYATEGSSGLDVASLKDKMLYAGETHLFQTGIRLSVPKGYEVQVRPRSGLALKKSLTVLNTPGTVDSDYRGDVGVILHNAGADPVQIKQGDRIAQLVVCKVVRPHITEGSVDVTERGEGGFGSTGQ